MDAWKIISELIGVQDVFFDDVKLFKNKHGRRAEFYCTQIFSRCRCHFCKTPLVKIHDYQDRYLQGPAVGVFSRVVIIVSTPRGWCNECNKNQRAEMPFAHPTFPSLTCGFAEVAGRLGRQLL